MITGRTFEPGLPPQYPCHTCGRKHRVIAVEDEFAWPARRRALLRKADAPHEILPAPIRTQIVEYGQRELDHTEHPLPIGIL